MAELTRGDADPYTFNLWHEMLPLSPVDGYLLSLLDGSRDSDALLEALLAIARRGLIRFVRDGEPVAGDAELRNTLAAAHRRDAAAPGGDEAVAYRRRRVMTLDAF